MDINGSFVMFPGQGDKLESESPEEYLSVTGVEEVARVQGEIFASSTFYMCTGLVSRLPGAIHLGEWGESCAFASRMVGGLGKGGT